MAQTRAAAELADQPRVAPMPDVRHAVLRRRRNELLHWWRRRPLRRPAAAAPATAAAATATDVGGSRTAWRGVVGGGAVVDVGDVNELAER